MHADNMDFYYVKILYYAIYTHYKILNGTSELKQG